MRVYLDHNATTPLHPEVLAAMSPFLTQRFGNASSVHAWGREARQALESARSTVAHALGTADVQSVVFTSGGTEADNLALFGVAAAQASRGCHVIVSAVEHPAVLTAADYLAQHGYVVTRLPVDSQGLLDPDQVRHAIRPDTVLVSIMHSNNETGVVLPVAEVGKICREAGVTFHTDAVQSLGRLPLDIDGLGVDLLSLSAHKLQGPKGVGALYIRRGTKMRAILHGGNQERSRRAGTENVPGTVGLARAIELSVRGMEGAAERWTVLRDRLEQGLLAALPGVAVNGHPTQRLPQTSNLAIAGVEAESLILALDLHGIGVSSGAACSSGSLEPSHVLLAMGHPRERAESSIRFSLGPETTAAEIDYVLTILPAIVRRMRRVGADRLAPEAVKT